MRILLSFLLLVSYAGFAGTVHARGGCHRLEKLCKKAGKKKHADCFDKILAGEPVDGVTAEQADIEACKAKMSKHK